MTNLHNPTSDRTPRDPIASGLRTKGTPAHAASPERSWTIAKIEAGARSRGTTPEGRLLAVFEVLDELFNRADREARSFVEVLAELSRGSHGGASGEEITTSFRALIDRLAEEAEFPDVEGFGLSWRILSNGAILKAVGGDLESATRAREMAVDLIARHRQPSTHDLGHRISSPVAIAGAVLLDYDVDLELGFEADGRYGTDVAKLTPVRHPVPVSGTPFSDADYLLWELG